MARSTRSPKRARKLGNFPSCIRQPPAPTGWPPYRRSGFLHPRTIQSDLPKASKVGFPPAPRPCARRARPGKIPAPSSFRRGAKGCAIGIRPDLERSGEGGLLKARGACFGRCHVGDKRHPRRSLDKQSRNSGGARPMGWRRISDFPDSHKDGRDVFLSVTLDGKSRVIIGRYEAGKKPDSFASLVCEGPSMTQPHYVSIPFHDVLAWAEYPAREASNEHCEFKAHLARPVSLYK